MCLFFNALSLPLGASCRSIGFLTCSSSSFFFIVNVPFYANQRWMNPDDSPTWGKNFLDVATVLETKHFLRGPFQTFIASYGTYDGEDNAPIDTTGYALGLGRIVGGVRIGQLRGQRVLCGDQMASFTFGTSLDDAPLYPIEKIHCIPEFSEKNELKESFNTFDWKGWNGTDTQRERDSFLSSETIFKSFRSYPSPAYSVVLPSANWTESKRLIQYLDDLNYIDLHTRALFVDILVYNPSLDYIVCCRMVVQLTPAGGAMATFKANSVRSSPIPFTGGWDTTSSFCEMIIISFYIYFLLHEVSYVSQEAQCFLICC